MNLDKGIIILGSSRGDGNTFQIASYLKKKLEFDLVDLTQYQIQPFDYSHKNQEDDFLPLLRNIIDNYQVLVFATPVYWYSMSGVLKTFFDRITDFLRIEKDTGRKLRGKSMAMVSCSSDARVYEGFSMPFKNTAQYLGMHYLGDSNSWIENGVIGSDVKERLDEFVSRVNSSFVGQKV